MRRPGRLISERLKNRLASLPGLAMSGIFIGVSGMMSVSFGYKIGEPSGYALVFAALALGVESFADLAVPLLWRKLGLLSRGGLVAFFALCLAYKITAANRFAAENLGKRETAVATASATYEIAKDRVEGLRRTIADTLDARPAAILQSEIDGLLRDPKTDGCSGKINGDVTAKVCPKVDALRTQLARAKARDAAQADLAPALAALSGQAPVAVRAQEDGGPVAAMLGAVGIKVGGWSEFVAHLIMALVEGGAILVPMLVGFASGEGALREAEQPRKPPAEPIENPETEASKPSLRRLTERGERDLADVTAFLAAETERAAGEHVQSTQLHSQYCAWKQASNTKPMSLAQFGTVLTWHLGLTKTKIDGRMHYESLRIKASQGEAGAVRKLRMVS